MSDKITIKYPIASNMRLVEAYITDNILVNIVEEKPTLKIGGYYEIESSFGLQKVIFQKQNDFILNNGNKITYIAIPELKFNQLSTVEIREFNDDLLKNGYMYNHNENRLFRVKKRAKKGEKYYFMTAKLKMSISTDNRDENSNSHYNCGNYFVSEEIEQLKQLINESVNKFKY